MSWMRPLFFLIRIRSVVRMYDDDWPTDALLESFLTSLQEMIFFPLPVTVQVQEEPISGEEELYEDNVKGKSKGKGEASSKNSSSVSSVPVSSENASGSRSINSNKGKGKGKGIGGIGATRLNTSIDLPTARLRPPTAKAKSQGRGGRKFLNHIT